MFRCQHVLGDGLSERETGAIETVPLHVCQDRHEERGFLTVGRQDPAAGLAEEVDTCRKNDELRLQGCQ